MDPAAEVHSRYNVTANGEELDIKDGYYVVSISGRGFRRLHRMGACHFRPGSGYRHFENLGPLRPEGCSYDDFCRRCFGAEIEVSSASTLSSGSSSDDGM